jgi:hypothetical protein
VITFLIGLANLKIGLATLMARGYICGQQCPQYILVWWLAGLATFTPDRDQ